MSWSQWCYVEWQKWQEIILVTSLSCLRLSTSNNTVCFSQLVSATGFAETCLQEIGDWAERMTRIQDPLSGAQGSLQHRKETVRPGSCWDLSLWVYIDTSLHGLGWLNYGLGDELNLLSLEVRLKILNL